MELDCQNKSFRKKSQDNLDWEGSTRGHTVQHPAQSRAHEAKMLRT